MKNFKFKKTYVFFSVILAFIIHLPVAFAQPIMKNMMPRNISDTDTIKEPVVTDIKGNMASKVYDSLKLNLHGLSEHAFQCAMKGFDYLVQKGKIANDHIISIVDFTKPSSQKRLFVIDLEKYKILFNTYVAHGQGSGGEMATKFSNIPESLQSSLGFYKTSSTYIGKNGFSMKLDGLENGINDNANERAIVMHGAPYVSAEVARSQGYIGRSWGCPAVPEELTKPIIEKIKNGSCLFIFSENNNYLHKSRIINS
jgi:L,D-transpeptidase catalytic domain